MRVGPLLLAVALLLATPAMPADAFFGPDENQVYATHDGTLGTIGAALSQGDARQVEIGLNELLDRMEKQLKRGELKLPLRPEYHARLLNLRADALRAGIPAGAWARWAPFDGYPQGPNDALAEQVGKLTYDAGYLALRLKEAKALQGRLAASKDPLHAFLLQQVLEPALAGVAIDQVRDKSKLAVDRLTRMLTSKPMPDGAPLDETMDRVKQAIKAIRAAGADPAMVMVPLEGRRLNLLEAVREAEPIVAAAVKRRQAAEAAERARVAKYRRLLKGDKARLVDREGLPEWWSADKDTPETMAAASTWRYRYNEDRGYYYVYYLFDGTGRIVKRNIERH